MSKAKDYSSQSYTPGATGPTKSQATNNKVDGAGKSREKDDMVGLNDKFVRLIDKVWKEPDLFFNLLFSTVEIFSLTPLLLL